MRIEKGYFLQPVPLFMLVVFVSSLIGIDLLGLFHWVWNSWVNLLAVLFGSYYSSYGYYSVPLFDGSTVQEFFEEKNDVRVLSYNIFMRPPLAKNNESDYKEIRLLEFYKVISDFDVIALQEIFTLGNSRPARLIKKAKTLGFNYYVQSTPPPLWSIKFVDAGLLILSKYPIVESDAHIYNAGNQIDNLAAKQVLYAKIEMPNTKRVLHVFTSHLQASYEENDAVTNQINDIIRADQIREMMEFVHEKCDNKPGDIIITGDFNADAKQNPDDEYSESEEYKSFMERVKSFSENYDCSDLLKLGYDGKHPSTYGDSQLRDGVLVPMENVLTNRNDYGLRMCIDYMIFLKNRNECGYEVSNKSDTVVEPFFLNNESLPVTQISDHYGISTVLRSC
eukprot:TRINITY_DN7022_c0_g1_i1.p1 TRINITY_DN7022_c0_g1~~TRINITY_DN7022_c0_g1_i1.p1  ORF type:complete len:393 (-),score=64.43 TRINITY_DN7022_c0_g1_i1:76-1254(-)